MAGIGAGASAGRILFALVMGAGLVGCTMTGEKGRTDSVKQEEVASSSAFKWPASLRVLSEQGLPLPDGPCRRLGESAAVVDYLDHSRILVGCPGLPEDVASQTALKASPEALVVGVVDGVTLVSGRPFPPVRAMMPVSFMLTGAVVGRQVARHVLQARTGDILSVSFVDRPASLYFNVLPPGGTYSDAIYVGTAAADPRLWMARAGRDGEYTVLVYQRGQAKDKGVRTPYMLRVQAEPRALPVKGESE